MDPWPAAFLCPISGSVMADPVIVSTGETYERLCIEAWLDLGQNLCIRKKIPIDRSFIVPNNALQNAIATMAEARGIEIYPPSRNIASYLAERLLHEEKSPLRSFVSVQNKEQVEEGNGTSGSGSTTEEGEEEADQGEHGLGFGSKKERRHGLRFGSETGRNTERYGLGFEQPRKEDIPRNGLWFDRDDPRPAENERDVLESHMNVRSFGKNIYNDSGFDRKQSNVLGLSRNRSTGLGRNESQSIETTVERSRIQEKNKQIRNTSGRDVMNHMKSNDVTMSPDRVFMIKNPWPGETEYDAGMNSNVRGVSSAWPDREVDYNANVIPSKGANASSRPHKSELSDHLIASDSRGTTFLVDTHLSSKGANTSPWPHKNEPADHLLTPDNSITPPSLVVRPSSYVWEDMPHRAFSLDSLLDKLQDIDGKKQADGLSELRSLTRNESNRLALCNPDIIQALIPLLNSQDPAIQIDATATLVNLSMENQNKVKIVREGAVPSLVKVLKHGVPEGRHHAAGVTFNLSLAEENRHLLGVLDTIPPLIDLLRSGPPGAQQDASLALYHLSFLRMNANKLVKLRAVPILLNLAKSQERPKVAYRALHILHNVASIPEGQASLLQLDAVTKLVKVLAPQRWDEGAQIQEQAASVLLVLSKGNLRFKFMAIQAGAQEFLNALARNGTPRGRAKAVALLAVMKESSSEIEDPESYSIISRQYMRQNLGRSDEQPNSSAF